MSYSLLGKYSPTTFPANTFLCVYLLNLLLSFAFINLVKTEPHEFVINVCSLRVY